MCVASCEILHEARILSVCFGAGDWTGGKWLSIHFTTGLYSLKQDFEGDDNDDMNAIHFF
jgi:hypothetical protein